MKCVAELLKDIAKYLVKQYRKSYLVVFEYTMVSDEVWEKLIKPYMISTIDEVLKDPVIVCYKGHKVKLSQVINAPEEIFKLIEYGYFSEEDLK